jgi:hypothetical protein
MREKKTFFTKYAASRARNATFCTSTDIANDLSASGQKSATLFSNKISQSGRIDLLFLYCPSRQQISPTSCATHMAEQHCRTQMTTARRVPSWRMDRRGRDVCCQTDNLSAHQAVYSCTFAWEQSPWDTWKCANETAGAWGAALRAGRQRQERHALAAP